MSSDVRALAKEYVSWDTNAATRAAIQKLLDADDVPALTSALGSRLEFGTAGLRGPMAAGYTAMNELTVLQTTQGLALYLEQTFGAAEAHAAGVALGWDHRAAAGGLCSAKFALLAAEVLVNRGFRVVLLDGLVHTPLVSFAVVKRGCKAGVMVTASHNPKEDNGYKVYWDNGAQIIPPHDKGIAACITKSLKPWCAYKCHAEAEAFASEARVERCTAALADEYYAQMVSELCRYPKENAQVGASLPIIYTAMHGIGAPWLRRAFEAFGLPPPIPVAQQNEPDPTFPTVAFPNPEEGAGALALAFQTAEAHGSRLVIANDPDADRLAVAEKGESGQWHVLSGNEIGILFADWQWTHSPSRNSGGGTKKRSKGKPVAMLSSAVSSRMLKAYALAEGFHWEETLTGFKWLCSRAVELRAEGYDVPFCFEEAIGFCLGDVVHDKDGVSAGAVLGEMAHYLQRTHGRTLTQHLDALAGKLGHFVQSNSYIVCKQPSTTAAIFERLRNDGHYWLRLGGFRIDGVRDLTTGVDTTVPSGVASLPLSKSSHMLTYTFSNGLVATVRGSGTEPKIKWYCEMGGATSRAEALKMVNELVALIIQEMLEPEKNGLQLRK